MPVPSAEKCILCVRWMVVGRREPVDRGPPLQLPPSPQALLLTDSSEEMRAVLMAVKAFFHTYVGKFIR